MPRLVINDVPEEMYEAISRAALMESRSITQQAAALLRSALKIREEQSSRRKSVLKELEGVRIKNTGRLPDPAGLMREERD